MIARIVYAVILTLYCGAALMITVSTFTLFVRDPGERYLFSQTVGTFVDRCGMLGSAANVVLLILSCIAMDKRLILVGLVLLGVSAIMFARIRWLFLAV
jgi:hypothetical protein